MGQVVVNSSEAVNNIPCTNWQIDAGGKTTGLARSIQLENRRKEREENREE